MLIKLFVRKQIDFDLTMISISPYKRFHACKTSTIEANNRNGNEPERRRWPAGLRGPVGVQRACEI